MHLKSSVKLTYYWLHIITYIHIYSSHIICTGGLRTNIKVNLLFKHSLNFRCVPSTSCGYGFGKPDALQLYSHFVLTCLGSDPYLSYLYSFDRILFFSNPNPVIVFEGYSFCHLDNLLLSFLTFIQCTTDKFVWSESSATSQSTTITYYSGPCSMEDTILRI